MRRWLNCLLIGVLTCSLSVDTAKACWYLRHAHSHAARGCWRPACPPVATWPACHDVVVSDAACGSGLACGSVVIVDGWRDDVCCDGASGNVVNVAESSTVAESVVAPSEPAIAAEPTPAQAEPIVAPQNGVAAVAPAVPELKPAVDSAPAVEPVVALEPAPVEPAPVEPATEPTPVEPAVAPDVAPPAEPAPQEPQPEPVAAVEPPAPPAEPNIFEEVESAADAALLAPEGTEPAAESGAASSEPSADNLFGEPAAAATEPAPEPVADPLAEPSAAEPALEPAADVSSAPAEPATAPAADDAPAPAPAADEPASEPAAEEPAEETDPFSDAGREPLRRWVDDTGSYATVGMLVDVRAEGVEIRKANGRTVIVPLDRLSDHDRAYAADAETRLAADRAPTSRETAGL